MKGAMTFLFPDAPLPTDARPKLQQLSALTPKGEELAVELAIRDWSRREDDVAQRLRRVDTRRMTYLRSLFAQFCADQNDVEARSMMLYSLVFGSYFIAAEHGGRTRSQVLRLAINHLLSGSREY